MVSNEYIDRIYIDKLSELCGESYVKNNSYNLLKCMELCGIIYVLLLRNICITFPVSLYYFFGLYVLSFQTICITFTESFSAKVIHIFRKGYTYIPQR